MKNATLVGWLVLCAFFGLFGPPVFGPASARWTGFAVMAVSALIGSGAITMLWPRITDR